MTNEELIERLRENADLDAAEHVPHDVVQMQYEAAAAIKSLRQQLATVTAERDELVAALRKVESGSFIQSMELDEIVGRMRDIAAAALAKLGADKTALQENEEKAAMFGYKAAACLCCGNHDTNVCGQCDAGESGADKGEK